MLFNYSILKPGNRLHVKTYISHERPQFIWTFKVDILEKYNDFFSSFIIHRQKNLVVPKISIWNIKLINVM